MGLFQALYGIGMTIGPVMVGNIASASSYQTAYLVFAVISALSVPLAAVSLPWMKRKQERVHG